MTSDHYKTMLPIITAFANGDTIQFLGTDNIWFDVTDVDFEKEPERYRIKLKPIELWGALYEDGAMPTYSTYRGAANNLGRAGFSRIIHLIEQPN